jgi:hypothetical protein
MATHAEVEAGRAASASRRSKTSQSRRVKEKQK